MKGITGNILGKIILILIGLYLIASAFFVGILLNKTLQEHYGKINVFPIFATFILVYFAFDLIFRFIIQELPTLAVQPYLLHNIRRKNLVSFLNIRSLFSFFNLLPILLFAPFIFEFIGNENGYVIAISIFWIIISLCIGNHFLILFVKRKAIINNWWLLGVVITVAIIVALNNLNVISISIISLTIFKVILSHPLFCIAFTLYPATSHYFNSQLLINNFYFDGTTKKPKNYLNNLIQTILPGESLINIDLKLILRNKQPRSVLLMSIIFLSYGLLMFKQELIQKVGLSLPLLGSIVIIGIFPGTYGRYFFAWQGANFDGLMIQNISFKTYLKNKFTLLTFFCSISFSIALLYGFMNYKLVFIISAAYFFCIGVLPIVAAYCSMLDCKRIDLSKSSSFNYQGVSSKQWLHSFAISVIPMAFYLPFHLLGKQWFGIVSVGLVGLVNYIFQDRWINYFNNLFPKNKYKLLEGFRTK